MHWKCEFYSTFDEFNFSIECEISLSRCTSWCIESELLLSLVLVPRSKCNFDSFSCWSRIVFIWFIELPENARSFPTKNNLSKKSWQKINYLPLWKSSSSEIRFFSMCFTSWKPWLSKVWCFILRDAKFCKLLERLFFDAALESIG